MEYRNIPGTDEKISIIGLGAFFDYAKLDKFGEILDTALKSGINLIDTVSHKKEAFGIYRDVLREYERSQYYLQIHFGSDYSNGNYGWTDNLELIKKNIDYQISTIACNYADIGIVHCIDDVESYEKVMSGGLWDYMMKLKNEGVLRHIGCSTHDPVILRKFVDTGEISVAMFSINMVYDYLNLGNCAKGTLEDRYKIYEYCKDKGVGLLAMKPFAGKRLLNSELNSFKKAFTPCQCIKYVLDRPAVLSSICGVGTIEELNAALDLLTASEAELDYSEVYSILDNLGVMLNDCVYCNHCMPCPAGIDVGLTNKYYDLAVLGDELAVQHYKNLLVHADSCMGCGHCNKACPFEVNQMKKMKEIAHYFEC